MPREPRVVLGALNIAADPHPEDIYRRLFQAAANREVHLRGSDYAKVTAPQDRETDPPSFYGRVLVWTEIDKNGKWLNQKKNEEATSEDKAKISIPEGIDPNFRSFNFVFLEKQHLLVLEYQNELSQSFGPKSAERVFSTLFSEDYFGEDTPDVSVTVVPSTDALEKIYNIPRLRHLEIFIIRPNADDLTDATGKVLDRLIKQGAKSQKLELQKKAKVKSLKPDNDTKALAAVAATNGHVSGNGFDENGKPVFESTEKHPKTVALEVSGTSSIGVLFNGIRHFL
jgi:hypothetical protein